MANEHLKKHFNLKPEVAKIFADLETYRDYCRVNMLKFDEADLYHSAAWARCQGQQRYNQRRSYGQGYNQRQR